MRSSSDSSLLDVVVVGAGPVGLACGIAAQRHGYRYAILEKGCLVNSVFRFPVNMIFFTTPELMEIGNYPLITGHGKATRTEALDYYRSVARVENLRVITREKVIRVEGREGDFRVEAESRDGPRAYRTRFVVLATGYYDNPNYLGVPGEDLPHVSHYYTEAHPFAGRRVCVVGGRNSACEAALDLFRHDAEVTLVHRGESLGEGVKYWVLPDVQNRIRAREIRACFRSEIKEIRERSALLSIAGQEVEEAFDQVFLLTGYHPDHELLRRCGLQPHRETLGVRVDPETRESEEVPGIFLAGSVSAGYRTGTVFIENGRHDAEKIFSHLDEGRGRESERSAGQP